MPSCTITKTKKKFTPELIDDERQVVGHFLPEFVTGITHDSRKTRLQREMTGRCGERQVTAMHSVAGCNYASSTVVPNTLSQGTTCFGIDPYSFFAFDTVIASR